MHPCSRLSAAAPGRRLRSSSLPSSVSHPRWLIAQGRRSVLVVCGMSSGERAGPNSSCDVTSLEPRGRVSPGNPRRRRNTSTDKRRQAIRSPSLPSLAPGTRFRRALPLRSRGGASATARPLGVALRCTHRARPWSPSGRKGAVVHVCCTLSMGRRGALSLRRPAVRGDFRGNRVHGVGRRLWIREKFCVCAS